MVASAGFGLVESVAEFVIESVQCFLDFRRFLIICHFGGSHAQVIFANSVSSTLNFVSLNASLIVKALRLA